MSQFIDLAIRLDGQDPSDLINFLEDDGGAFLIVKEVAGDNHHFHAVVRSRRAVQPFRMAFKRAMPQLAGNGAYSIAVVRELDKYHRYLCKGDALGVWPEVVGANGIQYQDLEWQNAQHEAYWSENSRLAGERRNLNVLDASYNALRDRNVQWHNREEIARVYIREVVARGKSINTFACRSAVNLLSVRLCPDDSALDELARVVGAGP